MRILGVLNFNIVRGRSSIIKLENSENAQPYQHHSGLVSRGEREVASLRSIA
jgi:hypothetical protein